jgi:hypothetical protein
VGHLSEFLKEVCNENSDVNDNIKQESDIKGPEYFYVTVSFYNMRGGDRNCKFWDPLHRCLNRGGDGGRMLGWVSKK